MKRKISYDRSFASCEKSLYWSKRNIKSPEECSKSSHDKIWFDCNICFHEFDMTLNHITSGGQWCPYCANQKLCNDEECNDCFERSFASHEKSIYWSHNNTNNPRDCSKSSNKKYLFNCQLCKHEFKIALGNITNGGNWCPYCAKPSNKLCDNQDCNFCFEKSFASHEKSLYWSKKNKKTPRDCFKSSSMKYLFDCDNKTCNHEFEMSLHNISNGDCWCPYCSHNKLCDNQNCNHCFEKSFASHEKSIYWSKKNKKSSRQCFKSSREKIWFNCLSCKHEFYMILYSITNGNCWCPNCRHKTELKLHNFLITLLPFPVKRQFRADWCRNPLTNRYLPFDFEIETLKIIFELDGRQHNEVHEHFHRNGISDLIAQKDRDVYKYECAIANGYEVYRLDQETVLHDKIDWQSLIIGIINEKLILLK